MNRRSATTTKVFVGSLPPGTTVDELRELFSPYGEIAECDVVNRCGFLHLEDKQLAFKAIDDLNNSSFKGARISVEKGRMKPPPHRDGGGGGGGGGRGARNGFGPMRNNRDNYRGGPYMRDGGDFDRRGPPRAPMGGNGYGGGRGGYDRGFDSRQPSNMMPPSRPMNDYGNGPDRRPYMDDRRGGYPEERRYNDGYMGPGGDDRMYPEDRNIYQEDRRPMMNERQPPMDQRPPFERRPMMDERKPYDDRNMMGDRRGAPMDDRRSLMTDRRPLMEPQGPGGLGTSPGGPMHPPMPPMNHPSGSYDRRPQPDMYSRRDVPPKPMGGGGYNDAPRNAGYDSYNAPMQNRGYAGGPGPRRDMPPVRRF